MTDKPTVKELLAALANKDAEIQQLRDTVRTQIDINDKQANELSCSKDAVKAADSVIMCLHARIKELEKVVREELAMAEAEWISVGRHPASRFAHSVAFYKRVLNPQTQDEAQANRMDVKDDR